MQYVKNKEDSEKLPSARNMVRDGRSDLMRAVQKHGGFVLVAARLGLKTARGSHVAWNEMNVTKFVDHYGHLCERDEMNGKGKVRRRQLRTQKERYIADKEGRLDLNKVRQLATDLFGSDAAQLIVHCLEGQLTTRADHPS